ncbi:MAG: response regulator [Hyphomicrobiales bacterium]
MSGQHVALIVEDEPEMAAEIADLLRSFGHDHIHVETKAAAIEALDAGGFCYVLLDLKIKPDEKSIKPRIDSGMTLLEEIRARYPNRNSHDIHLMPVLIVSGQAKEHEDVVKAFQKGTDDFIRKPLGLDNQDIGSKIRRCLERSGRRDHVACPAMSAQAASRANADDTGKPGFNHTADYSEVTSNGMLYLFDGTIQQNVIRILHEAEQRGEPWQSGKAVLADAGSRDTKMANLFGRHPCWGTLLMSNKHGKYRLRTA